MTLANPPTLMVVSQIYVPINRLSSKPWCQIRLDIVWPVRSQYISPRPTISEPGKSIALAIVIRKLEVLPSGVFPNNRYMACTARPDSCDSTTFDTPVIPRATVLTHDCSWEESFAISPEIVRGSLRGCQTSDALRHSFAQHLGNIGDLDLYRVAKSAGRPSRVWPNNG